MNANGRLQQHLFLIQLPRGRPMAGPLAAIYCCSHEQLNKSSQYLNYLR